MGLRGSWFILFVRLLLLRLVRRVSAGVASGPCDVSPLIFSLDQHGSNSTPAARSRQPTVGSQQPTASSRRKSTLLCRSREAREARRAVRRRAVRAGRSGRFPGKPRVSATQARACSDLPARSSRHAMRTSDHASRACARGSRRAHSGMHGRGLILRKRAFGGAASENQLASSGACFRWGHDRSEGGPERAWRASGSPTAASRHLLPLVDHFRASDPHLRERGPLWVA